MSSPYTASISEFVNRFGTSQDRIDILQGLLDYRQRLAHVGITNGFQWIDGSFVEDVETLRRRSPADIDIVTLAPRPVADLAQWATLVNANLELFDPPQTKSRFKVDAYFVDTALAAPTAIDDAMYFFSLFSHQRATSLWKGLVKIELNSDDNVALRKLGTVVI